MEKKKYCKRLMLRTAALVAVVMLIIGLCFGKVVEANVWEEVGKWVFMYFPICAIFETFAYILAPLFWHIKYDGKNTGEPEALD